MLKIRLSKVGRKHEPVYRLVLTDKRNASKSGKFLEILGSFDSRNAEKAVFNDEKIKYWTSKGAQLSPTVHNLLLKRGVITGQKISVLPPTTVSATKAKDEAKKNEKVAAVAEAPIVEETPAEEPAPAPEEAPVETAPEEPKTE